ncbi:MAG: GNAT family N-acetyltransferase [Brevundimonas sp.]
MSAIVHHPADSRFDQTVPGPDGAARRVWADYRRQGEVYALLHVEADPALRGSGAAGRFMAALADHARAQGLSLAPRCSYAVAWFKRNPDQGDVLAP